MTSSWPFHGDGALARARKVARAYRERLSTLDPTGCAALDEQLAAWGESWVAPRVLRYDLDDWLDARDAADVAAVSMAALRQWRRRGLIAGRQTSQGWHYLARDVLRLSSEVRRRKVAEWHS